MATTAKASQHAAVGSYLGFTLQDVRLAFHLLDSPPGCLVSIEHQDDISIEYPDGSLVFEQVKSAPKTNPISDLHPELWKTLANFGDGKKQHGKGKTCRFQIYVVPPRSGPIADRIHSTTSDVEADALISDIKKLSTPSPGKKSVAQLNRFGKLPTEEQRYVVKNTSILNIDEDEYEPIRKLMGDGVSLSPAIVKEACKYIIGSVQKTAREMMKAGVPATLSGDDYKAELQAFIIRTNMKRLLPSAPAPDSDAVDAEYLQRRVFIRQLELISASKDLQVSAVADYMQASATKAEWAADGLIVSSALERWDENLTNAHIAYKIRADAFHGGKTPIERGAGILADCYLHNQLLDEDSVSPDFIRGSFHSLADLKRIGWHEQYKDKLAEDQ